MEAPFQIVGCVLAAKPAVELIDGFAAQVRRERGAVLVKSAQGATFVRFGAADASLVSMAIEAARNAKTTRLRFGFAVGAKDANGGDAEGLDISTRSIVQASDLAAGADDGEVLVSPQLAVRLIEAGFALRSRQVPLPGGRLVPACSLDLAGGAGDARHEPPVAAVHAPRVVPDARPKARAAGGLAPLSPALAEQPAQEAAAASPQAADALGNVFQALLAQAEEIARRQADLEARQDAVLGKMTLVDEGSVSTRHLSELESEIDAQVARVEGRLDVIEKLEQRVVHVQAVIADVERRLAAQLHRRGEIESLKVLGDALLAQLVDAQPRLEAVSALQERLQPMAAQVAALTQGLAQSQEQLGGLEGRMAELDRSVEAVDRKIDSLAEREALVTAMQAELDSIGELSARSRADLQFLTDQHAGLADLRTKVEGLLGRVEETDGKIEMIESRRKLVEEVQASASSITHMLGDIQLKMELLDDQRVVIEHVGDKLARLDFSVQEAQNTLRALQREREVAGRIEQGLKALRARTGLSQAI